LVLCGVTTLGLGLGCTEKGRSLVLVDLSSALMLDHVSVVVTQSSQNVGEATAVWMTTPQPLELGVYLPKTVTGLVDVIACGFDAKGATIAASPTDPASLTATVQPGTATPPVQITLVAGTPPALCATIGGAGGNGGGGKAGGGNGGASGSGGAAGGLGDSGAAAGGSGGGIGGIGGASGSAGAAGSGGGASGTGGGGASGTGGSGGSGGSGGQGGVAGGSGGKGGASGSGATGGSAGSGGAGGAVGPSWRGAVAVGADAAVHESFPSVAVDSTGNAVIVYEHGSDIWFSHYSATSSTWSPPAQLETQGGQALTPIVAVDKNGNYLVVWRQTADSTLQGVYESTSSNGTTWSSVGTITTDDAFNPVMAMNANGAAIVAWTESTGSAYQAAASIRGATGGTWSAVQVLRPGDDYGDRNTAVAMSGMGQAFVGWEQNDGGATAENSIWLRQYTSAGWQPAALFESYNANICYNVSIAANNAGSAIVSYIEVTVSNLQLLARRYTPTTGFAPTPLLIAQGADIDNAVPPSVTLDESGMATFAFSLDFQTGYQAIAARTGPTDTSSPNLSELDPGNIAAGDGTVAQSPMPTVRNDPAGNVTIIWRKTTNGSRFDLWSDRFAAAGNFWGVATPIETRDTDSVAWPALGVGANGTAVATWHYDPALDVWANVFR
jgi:hypothetical protein